VPLRARIPRATRSRFSTRLRLLLPAALERSLDELQPLFTGWQTKENSADLTYRDGL
jgi:hypothetical protein